MVQELGKRQKGKKTEGRKVGSKEVSKEGEEGKREGRRREEVLGIPMPSKQESRSLEGSMVVFCSPMTSKLAICATSCSSQGLKVQTDLPM